MGMDKSWRHEQPMGFLFTSVYTFGPHKIQRCLRVEKIGFYLAKLHLRIEPDHELDRRTEGRAYRLWCDGLSQSFRDQRAESIYFGERGDLATRM